MSVDSFLQRYIENKQLTRAEARRLTGSDKELLRHFSAREILNKSTLKVSEVLKAGFRNLEALALDDTDSDKCGFENVLIERVIKGDLDIRFAYCPPLQDFVKTRKIKLEKALSFKKAEKDILGLRITQSLLRAGALTPKEALGVGVENLMILASNSEVRDYVVQGKLKAHFAFCPPLQRFFRVRTLSISDVQSFSKSEKALLSLDSAKTLLSKKWFSPKDIIAAGFKNLEILNANRKMLEEACNRELHLRVAFCPPLQRFLKNRKFSIKRLEKLSQAQRELLTLDSAKQMLDSKMFTVSKVIETGPENLKILNANQPLLDLVCAGKLDPCLDFSSFSKKSVLRK